MTFWCWFKQSNKNFINFIMDLGHWSILNFLATGYYSIIILSKCDVSNTFHHIIFVVYCFHLTYLSLLPIQGKDCFFQLREWLISQFQMFFQSSGNNSHSSICTTKWCHERHITITIWVNSHNAFCSCERVET